MIFVMIVKLIQIFNELSFRNNRLLGSGDDLKVLGI